MGWTVRGLRAARQWLGATGTTTVAGVLILAVTVPFLDRAVTNTVLLRQGLVPLAAQDDAAALGIPTSARATMMTLTTALLLGASLLALVIGIGLLARRTWARELGLLLFGLFTLSLPLSLVGLLSNPPAPDARVGLLVGLVDLVIVVLLAARATSDDLDRAGMQRKDRRHRAAGPG